MPNRDELSTRRASLSSAKLALLESWVRDGSGVPGDAQTIISRRSEKEPAPLSFAQQRLWFIDRLEPGRPVYNVPLAYRVTGQLNIGALEESLREIVQRHEALRTTFPAVDGQPDQVIASGVDLALETVDLRGLPENQREFKAQALATEEAQRPFDLANGPVFRATLVRLHDEELLLLLTMHHIVSDGWSLGVLIREMATLYEAFSAGKPSPLPDLPIQYRDFAHWQREWLQGEVLEEQLSYWKSQCDQLPLLELPSDRPRPPVQSYQGANHWFDLPDGLIQALKTLSQREGATLFMALLAAFQILLHRYSGQDDIVVGSPIANRNRAEIEGLIGFFVNTLVMRTDLSGNPTFRQLLARVGEVTLGSYAHQDLPFEKLVEEIQPERDSGHNPLFQVAFVLQNAPMPILRLPGLTLSSFEVDRKASTFDLTLELRESPDGINGRFEYNTDLFDAATISRMAGHFQTLLEGIVADPERRLSDLPLLPEAERRQLLVVWNDTQIDYSVDSCIHELFEAQVERAPEAVAVVFEGEQLTYRELNRRANQLAHHLRKLGVEPETLVGICVERSLEMMVALLGILKAGGAYLPLDSAYPKERLAFMLEDSKVPVLLTQQRVTESLPDHGAKVIYLDTGWDAIAQEPGDNLDTGVAPGNLAYVIYTSGSSGVPKGVMVQHQGLCNVSETQIKEFGVGPGSRVLQFSSLSYDASIFEIVMGLCSGATLCLGTREALMPGPGLAQLMRDQAITIVVLPPSALAAVPAGEFPALHTITVAGEACSVELLERWAAGRQFFNLYGPTEGTIWATFTECTDGMGKPPIGRPIANVQVYILDSHLGPLPVGVPGELHIGGVGVARSYLNRPELTAEKFIPNPFSDQPGARLYKTGDLVRYLPDGNIEFLGRIDNQVKIRGLRIELGEIETVLGNHPAVREAVVQLREDAPGDKRLVAYVVPGQESVPKVAELLGFAKEKLPAYMVPSAIITLDALPLSPNGKLDHRALPVPEAVRPELESAYVAPRTHDQRTIAEVWQEVLRVEKVGLHDNFFDLGGHSLLITQVHGKLLGVLSKDLSLIDLFKYPTVDALANYLQPGDDQQPSESVELQQKKLEPFFFGSPEKPLFGCYHPPRSGPVRDRGVLLCYPMGDEYIRSHRSYLQLATRLSDAGFPVLRFDFYGCGDSGGSSEEGDISQWLTDISTAIDEIRDRSGSFKVCLVGFRLGGTLSVMAGADLGNIDSMVVWEPVVDGKAYIGELVTQHQKELKGLIENPRPNGRSERPTELLGFPLTDAMFTDIHNVDLYSVRNKPANRLLVIASEKEAGDGRLREHLNNLGADAEYQHVPDPKIWLHRQRSLVPNEILQSVVSWISEDY